MKIITAHSTAEIVLVSKGEIICANLESSELQTKKKNVFIDALIRCFVADVSVGVARKLFLSNITHPDREPQRLYLLGPGYYSNEWVNSRIVKDENQGMSIKGSGIMILTGYIGIVTENLTTNLLAQKIWP